MAPWPSGKAKVCNTSTPGSNPGGASSPDRKIRTFSLLEISSVFCFFLEKRKGDSSEEINLAQIAAFMHDIGNVINRIDHAQSGAIMSFRILDKLGMDSESISKIINAIGNHDESTAQPVSAISAALILADKSDVRRSRVRQINKSDFDIHDRVNYAVTKKEIAFDGKEFVLSLEIDLNICSIMNYFEIFMKRMLLCQKASDYLKIKFSLIINGTKMI